MGSNTPKQYVPLEGKPIALYALEALRSCPYIHEIIVVCARPYQSIFQRDNNEIVFAQPGRRRQDSVFNAFQLVSEECPLVLIHDAARPFILQEDMSRVIRAGEKYGAATLASPVTSTIKRADSSGMVEETLERKTLYAISTPQVLRKEILTEGFARVQKSGETVTDDVSLAEVINRPVKLVMGSDSNIKITTPEDLDIATVYLSKKREEHSFAQI
jgi:2-C-methyl-D-erythritol 4-phosphate cytidylyltransferase